MAELLTGKTAEALAQIEAHRAELAATESTLRSVTDVATLQKLMVHARTIERYHSLPDTICEAIDERAGALGISAATLF